VVLGFVSRTLIRAFRYVVYDPPYTLPSRILLVHSLVYPNASAAASGSLPARPSTHVSLSLPSSIGSMQIRRLAIARASDTSNVTWAGISYATPDASPFGDEVVQSAAVSDGVDVAGTASSRYLVKPSMLTCMQRRRR
jgi:hypothetical protein